MTVPTLPPSSNLITVGGKTYRPLTSGQREAMTRDMEKKRAWHLVLLDENKQRRTAFMRGPQTRDEVILQCKTTFANWQLLDIQPASSSTPPPGAKAVPSSAYEFGVLKSLQTLRRR